jgi:hypothetical protein
MDIQSDSETQVMDVRTTKFDYANGRRRSSVQGISSDGVSRRNVIRPPVWP